MGLQKQGSRKMGDWEERRRGSPSQDVIKEKTFFLIKNDWSKKTTQFYEPEVT